MRYALPIYTLIAAVLLGLCFPGRLAADGARLAVGDIIAVRGGGRKGPLQEL